MRQMPYCCWREACSDAADAALEPSFTKWVVIISGGPACMQHCPAEYLA